MNAMSSWYLSESCFSWKSQKSDVSLSKILPLNSHNYVKVYFDQIVDSLKVISDSNK